VVSVPQFQKPCPTALRNEKRLILHCCRNMIRIIKIRTSLRRQLIGVHDGKCGSLGFGRPKRRCKDNTKMDLDQGWANYGPRAKYGPLRGSMRPAEGLENAKKN
jgi:hypothetical protein